jgi:hypothetical protein
MNIKRYLLLPVFAGALSANGDGTTVTAGAADHRRPADHGRGVLPLDRRESLPPPQLRGLGRLRRAVEAPEVAVALDLPPLDRVAALAGLQLVHQKSLTALPRRAP